MCKLFSTWEKEIRAYCNENGLDFAKVERSGKCWGQDMLVLQHIDAQSGKRGLLDETPAPVVLTVERSKDGLIFTQTEYTRQYLTQ